MMKIPPVKLNNQFEKFQTQSLKGETTQFILINKMRFFETNYKKLGMHEQYFDMTFNFVTKLNEAKMYDFSGIILSALSKMPFLNAEQKEAVLKLALQVAKIQKDDIHILSKIVDLKRLYKEQGRKHKYVSILHEEVNQLDKMLKDFDKTTGNFRTCFRKPSDYSKYELFLAKSLTEIGKACLSIQPRDARAKLLQARGIFEKYGRDKEVSFTKLLLSQIRQK